VEAFLAPDLDAIARERHQPLVQQPRRKTERADIVLVESHMAGVLETCARLRRLGRPRPILLSVGGARPRIRRAGTRDVGPARREPLGCLR
jgi:hypothetical protein